MTTPCILLLTGLMPFYFLSIVVTIGTRHMSTEEKTASTMSTKEKMKKAVKEYGSTVVVFHVTISLFSLGACYLLVSRYVINQLHITM